MRRSLKILTFAGLVLVLFHQTGEEIHSMDPVTGVVDRDYRITEFGAVGDGITLNTLYIQQAIDHCAEEGGGRVIIVPGTFLTGTLVMRSHVELHVSQGAILLGSTDPGDYPEMVTGYRFYGDDWVKQSLIFGSNLEYIAITGRGVIDGQGAAFKVTIRRKPDRYRNRPYLIRFTECNGVKVKDVTMQNSAMWMQHYLACENLLVENIRVYNHCNKNNDMIDIDGCRDVIITGCTGDTDDDALTLKSTSPRACENITISNCVLSSHCNAIKFGTESTGGFKNIILTNCRVKPSAKQEVIYGFPGGISGISLEVVDGGIMDGVTISDVQIEGPEVPIFIRLGDRARPYMEGAEKPKTGILQNIHLQNIVIRNAGKTGCSVTGMEGFPARNISLHQITMELQGGMDDSGDDLDVPEKAEDYPEATMFGVLPASVLYMRHLENIDLSDISVRFREPDDRIHLLAEDVAGLRYSRIQVAGSGKLRVVEEN